MLRLPPGHLTRDFLRYARIEVPARLSKLTDALGKGGASGEIDASSWTWRGVFEPLRDPAFFAQVTLDEELGTIGWPNGADVAPETLHLWVTGSRDRLSA